MPTIKQIQHFQAVLRAGTAQGAARSVHVSQPALTRSITNMEEELGIKLFERSRSGMLPTEFAEQLAPRYEQILLELEDIRREAQLHTNLETGQLRIGFGQAVREHLTRQCLPQFAEQYPGVSIVVREGTAPELVAALQQREVDMIVAGHDSFREYNLIRAQHILDIPIKVVVSGSHPLLARSSVTLKDLMGYPSAVPTSLGGQHPLRRLAEIGPEQSPHIMCSDYDVLESIAQRTDAWTVLLDSKLQRNLPAGMTLLEVDGFDMLIKLSVIELQNRSRSPAASEFVGVLKSLLGV